MTDPKPGVDSGGNVTGLLSVLKDEPISSSETQIEDKTCIQGEELIKDKTHILGTKETSKDAGKKPTGKVILSMGFLRQTQSQLLKMRNAPTAKTKPDSDVLHRKWKDGDRKEMDSSKMSERSSRPSRTIPESGSAFENNVTRSSKKTGKEPIMSPILRKASRKENICSDSPASIRSGRNREKPRILGMSSSPEVLSPLTSPTQSENDMNSPTISDKDLITTNMDRKSDNESKPFLKLSTVVRHCKSPSPLSDSCAASPNEQREPTNKSPCPSTRVKVHASTSRAGKLEMMSHVIKSKTSSVLQPKGTIHLSVTSASQSTTQRSSSLLSSEVTTNTPNNIDIPCYPDCKFTSGQGQQKSREFDRTNTTEHENTMSCSNEQISGNTICAQITRSLDVAFGECVDGSGFTIVQQSEQKMVGVQIDTADHVKCGKETLRAIPSQESTHSKDEYNTLSVDGEYEDGEKEDGSEYPCQNRIDCSKISCKPDDEIVLSETLSKICSEKSKSVKVIAPESCAQARRVTGDKSASLNTHAKNNGKFQKTAKENENIRKKERSPNLFKHHQKETSRCTDHSQSGQQLRDGQQKGGSEPTRRAQLNTQQRADNTSCRLSQGGGSSIKTSTQGLQSGLKSVHGITADSKLPRKAEPKKTDLEMSRSRKRLTESELSKQATVTRNDVTRRLRGLVQQKATSTTRSSVLEVKSLTSTRESSVDTRFDDETASVTSDLSSIASSSVSSRSATRSDTRAGKPLKTTLTNSSHISNTGLQLKSPSSHRNNATSDKAVSLSNNRPSRQPLITSRNIAKEQAKNGIKTVVPSKGSNRTLIETRQALGGVKCGVREATQINTGKHGVEESPMGFGELVEEQIVQINVEDNQGEIFEIITSDSKESCHVLSDNVGIRENVDTNLVKEVDTDLANELITPFVCSDVVGEKDILACEKTNDVIEERRKTDVSEGRKCEADVDDCHSSGHEEKEERIDKCDYLGNSHSSFTGLSALTAHESGRSRMEISLYTQTFPRAEPLGSRNTRPSTAPRFDTMPLAMVQARTTSYAPSHRKTWGGTLLKQSLGENKQGDSYHVTAIESGGTASGVKAAGSEMYSEENTSVRSRQRGEEGKVQTDNNFKLPGLSSRLSSSCVGCERDECKSDVCSETHIPSSGENKEFIYCVKTESESFHGILPGNYDVKTESESFHGILPGNYDVKFVENTSFREILSDCQFVNNTSESFHGAISDVVKMSIKSCDHELLKMQKREHKRENLSEVLLFPQDNTDHVSNIFSNSQTDVIMFNSSGTPQKCDTLSTQSPDNKSISNLFPDHVDKLNTEVPVDTECPDDKIMYCAPGDENMNNIMVASGDDSDEVSYKSLHNKCRGDHHLVRLAPDQAIFLDSNDSCFNSNETCFNSNDSCFAKLKSDRDELILKTLNGVSSQQAVSGLLNVNCKDYSYFGLTETAQDIVASSNDSPTPFYPNDHRYLKVDIYHHAGYQNLQANDDTDSDSTDADYSGCFGESSYQTPHITKSLSESSDGKQGDTISYGTPPHSNSEVRDGGKEEKADVGEELVVACSVGSKLLSEISRNSSLYESAMESVLHPQSNNNCEDILEDYDITNTDDVVGDVYDINVDEVDDDDDDNDSDDAESIASSESSFQSATSDILMSAMSRPTQELLLFEGSLTRRAGEGLAKLMVFDSENLEIAHGNQEEEEVVRGYNTVQLDTCYVAEKNTADVRYPKNIQMTSTPKTSLQHRYGRQTSSNRNRLVVAPKCSFLMRKSPSSGDEGLATDSSKWLLSSSSGAPSAQSVLENAGLEKQERLWDQRRKRSMSATGLNRTTSLNDVYGELEGKWVKSAMNSTIPRAITSSRRHSIRQMPHTRGMCAVACSIATTSSPVTFHETILDTHMANVQGSENSGNMASNVSTLPVSSPSSSSSCPLQAAPTTERKSRQKRIVETKVASNIPGRSFSIQSTKIPTPAMHRGKSPVISHIDDTARGITSLPQKHNYNELQKHPEILGMYENAQLSHTFHSDQKFITMNEAIESSNQNRQTEVTSSCRSPNSKMIYEKHEFTADADKKNNETTQLQESEERDSSKGNKFVSKIQQQPWISAVSQSKVNIGSSHKANSGKMATTDLHQSSASRLQPQRLTKVASDQRKLFDKTHKPKTNEHAFLLNTYSQVKSPNNHEDKCSQNMRGAIQEHKKYEISETLREINSTIDIGSKPGMEENIPTNRKDLDHESGHLNHECDSLISEGACLYSEDLSKLIGYSNTARSNEKCPTSEGSHNSDFDALPLADDPSPENELQICDSSKPEGRLLQYYSDLSESQSKEFSLHPAGAPLEAHDIRASLFESGYSSDIKSPDVRSPVNEIENSGLNSIQIISDSLESKVDNDNRIAAFVSCNTLNCQPHDRLNIQENSEMEIHFTKNETSTDNSEAEIFILSSAPEGRLDTLKVLNAGCEKCTKVELREMWGQEAGGGDEDEIPAIRVAGFSGSCRYQISPLCRCNEKTSYKSRADVNKANTTREQHNDNLACLCVQTQRNAGQLVCHSMTSESKTSSQNDEVYTNQTVIDYLPDSGHLTSFTSSRKTIHEQPGLGFVDDLNPEVVDLNPEVDDLNPEPSETLEKCNKKITSSNTPVDYNNFRPVRYSSDNNCVSFRPISDSLSDCNKFRSVHNSHGNCNTFRPVSNFHVNSFRPISNALEDCNNCRPLSYSQVDCNNFRLVSYPHEDCVHFRSVCKPHVDNNFRSVCKSHVDCSNFRPVCKSHVDCSNFRPVCKSHDRVSDISIMSVGPALGQISDKNCYERRLHAREINAEDDIMQTAGHIDDDSHVSNRFQCCSAHVTGDGNYACPWYNLMSRKTEQGINTERQEFGHPRPCTHIPEYITSAYNTSAHSDNECNSLDSYSSRNTIPIKSDAKASYLLVTNKAREATPSNECQNGKSENVSTHLESASNPSCLVFNGGRVMLQEECNLVTNLDILTADSDLDGCNFTVQGEVKDMVEISKFREFPEMIYESSATFKGSKCAYNDDVSNMNGKNTGGYCKDFHSVHTNSSGVKFHSSSSQTSHESSAKHTYTDNPVTIATESNRTQYSTKLSQERWIDHCAGFHQGLRSSPKCYDCLQSSSKCGICLQCSSKCVACLQSSSKYDSCLQSSSGCNCCLQLTSNCHQLKAETAAMPAIIHSSGSLNAATAINLNISSVCAHEDNVSGGKIRKLELASFSGVDAENYCPTENMVASIDSTSLPPRSYKTEQKEVINCSSQFTGSVNAGCSRHAHVTSCNKLSVPLDTSSLCYSNENPESQTPRWPCSSPHYEGPPREKSPLILEIVCELLSKVSSNENRAYPRAKPKSEADKLVMTKFTPLTPEEQARVNGMRVINKWKSMVKKSRVVTIRESLKVKLTGSNENTSNLPPPVSPTPPRKYKWARGESGIWKKVYLDAEVQENEQKSHENPSTSDPIVLSCEPFTHHLLTKIATQTDTNVSGEINNTSQCSSESTQSVTEKMLTFDSSSGKSKTENCLESVLNTSQVRTSQECSGIHVGERSCELDDKHKVGEITYVEGSDKIATTSMSSGQSGASGENAGVTSLTVLTLEPSEDARLQGRVNAAFGKRYQNLEADEENSILGIEEGYPYLGANEGHPKLGTDERCSNLETVEGHAVSRAGMANMNSLDSKSHSDRCQISERVTGTRHIDPRSRQIDSHRRRETGDNIETRQSVSVEFNEKTNTSAEDLPKISEDIPKIAENINITFQHSVNAENHTLSFSDESKLQFESSSGSCVSLSINDSSFQDKKVKTNEPPYTDFKSNDEGGLQDCVNYEKQLHEYCNTGMLGSDGAVCPLISSECLAVDSGECLLTTAKTHCLNNCENGAGIPSSVSASVCSEHEIVKGEDNIFELHKSCPKLIDSTQPMIEECGDGAFTSYNLFDCVSVTTTAAESVTKIPSVLSNTIDNELNKHMYCLDLAESSSMAELPGDNSSESANEPISNFVEDFGFNDAAILPTQTDFGFNDATILPTQTDFGFNDATILPTQTDFGSNDATILPTQTDFGSNDTTILPTQTDFAHSSVSLPSQAKPITNANQNKYDKILNNDKRPDSLSGQRFKKNLNLSVLPNSYTGKNDLASSQAEIVSSAFLEENIIAEPVETETDKGAGIMKNESTLSENVRLLESDGRVSAELKNKKPKKYTWPTVAESLKRFQKSIAGNPPSGQLLRKREQQLMMSSSRDGIAFRNMKGVSFGLKEKQEIRDEVRALNNRCVDDNQPSTMDTEHGHTHKTNIDRGCVVLKSCSNSESKLPFREVTSNMSVREVTSNMSVREVTSNMSGYSLNTQLVTSVEDSQFILSSSKVKCSQVLDNKIFSYKRAPTQTHNFVDSSYESLASHDIHSSNLASDAVHSSNLDSDAAHSSNLDYDAAHSSNLTCEAVHSSNMASDASHSSYLATEAVHSSNLASDAPHSSNLATEAVHSSNLATEAVHSSNLVPDSPHSSNIASRAAHYSNMAVDAIRSSNLDPNCKITFDSKINWTSACEDSETPSPSSTTTLVAQEVAGFVPDTRPVQLSGDVSSSCAGKGDNQNNEELSLLPQSDDHITSVNVVMDVASTISRSEQQDQQERHTKLLPLSSLQHHQHNQQLLCGIMVETTPPTLSSTEESPTSMDSVTSPSTTSTQTTVAATESSEHAAVLSPPTGSQRYMPSAKLISVSVWDTHDGDRALRHSRRLWATEEVATLAEISEVEEVHNSHDVSAGKAADLELQDQNRLQTKGGCQERVRASRSPVRPHCKERKAPRRSLSLPSGGLSYGDVKILYKDGHFVVMDASAEKTATKGVCEPTSVLEDVSEENERADDLTNMQLDNSSLGKGGNNDCDVESKVRAEILSLLERGISAPQRLATDGSLSFDGCDTVAGSRRSRTAVSGFMSLPRRKGHHGARPVSVDEARLLKYYSKSQQSLVSQAELDRRREEEQESSSLYGEVQGLKRNTSFTEAMGSAVLLNGMNGGTDSNIDSAELCDSRFDDSNHHIDNAEDSHINKSRSKGPGFFQRMLQKRKGSSSEKSLSAFSTKSQKNDLSSSSVSLASTTSTNQQSSSCKQDNRDSSIGRKMSFRGIFKRKNSADESARKTSSSDDPTSPSSGPVFTSDDTSAASLSSYSQRGFNQNMAETNLFREGLTCMDEVISHLQSSRTTANNSSQGSLHFSLSQNESDATPVALKTAIRRARSSSGRARSHGRISSGDRLSGDSLSEYDLSSPEFRNSDGSQTPRSHSPFSADVSLEGDQTLLASPTANGRSSPPVYQKLTSSPHGSRNRYKESETSAGEKETALTTSIHSVEMVSRNSNDSGIQNDGNVNSSAESILATVKLRKSKSPSPTLERPKSDTTVRWADLLEQVMEPSTVRYRQDATKLRRQPRPRSDIDETLSDADVGEEDEVGSDEFDENCEGGFRTTDSQKGVLINTSSMGNITMPRATISTIECVSSDDTNVSTVPAGTIVSTVAPAGGCSVSTVSNVSDDVRLLMRSRESLSSLVELRRPSRDGTASRLAKIRRLSTPQPITVRIEKPKPRPVKAARFLSGVLTHAHSMPENLDKLTRQNYLSLIGSDAQSITSQQSGGDDSSEDSEYSMDYHTEGSHSTRSSQITLAAFDHIVGNESLTYAEALWDHVTMDPDELGFRAGDLIRVKDATDKHWWFGVIDDHKGWFPATFVRLRVNQDIMEEEQAYFLAEEEALIAAEHAGNLTKSSNYIAKIQARCNVVNEIIGAERDYVKHLTDVVEGYVKQARKRPEMFPREKVAIIFSNIEEIFQFATDLLMELEKSVNHDEPHLSELGQCFLNKVKGFEMYSDYCNNHSAACEELRELYRNKRYRHFFEACRLLQEMIEIPLEGFLLTPVQKICKYHLQLAELLKFTPPDHADFCHVQRALEAMKKIAMLVNERKRKMESLEKLAAWQILVDDWEGPDILEGSSELIYSGELNKINHAGWSQERYFFLFDHQLVYCKKDLLKKSSFCYKGRISMDSCQVMSLPDGKDSQYNVNVRNAWKLHDTSNDKWYLLVAKTTAIRQRWLKAFHDERRRVKDDVENNFNIPNHAKQAVITSLKQKTSLNKPKGKSKSNQVNSMTEIISTLNRVSAIATLPRSKNRHKVKRDESHNKHKKINWFFLGKGKS